MAGFTDAELRARGLSPELIAAYRSPHRIWAGPLVDVRIDGERCRPPDEERRDAAIRLVEQSLRRARACSWWGRRA